MKTKLLAAVTILAGLALLISGCSTEGDPPPEYLPGYPEAGDFEDIDWSLESLGLPPDVSIVLLGTQITIRFNSEDGRVEGNAGANNYFGSYQLDGTRLTIGPLASTKLYRAEPEGVMEQEAEYLRLLEQAESYEVVRDKLRITSGDKVLIYTRAVP